jgi:hypothetical protein
VKVSVCKCDSCGKLIEDIEKAQRLEDTDICRSCLDDMKRSIERYVREMKPDVLNDKFAAFAVHVQTVMAKSVMCELRAEEMKKQGTAGFQK